jgi:hypothetical protein
MNYRDYISNIKFKFIRPNGLPRKKGLGKFIQLLNLLGNKESRYVDMFITNLPCKEKSTKRILYEIAEIPKMSTFAIGALINEGVSQINIGSAFVNVGVWNGYTYLAGLLNNSSNLCIGIDNFSEFGGPREEFLGRFNRYKSDKHKFYDMDYIDYFEQIHQQPIGFYFYDGGHRYEDQLKALEVAEPFFDEKCLILVDDTNPSIWNGDPRRATLDFISSRKDRYEIILDVATSYNSHPTWWSGIILFQKIQKNV